MAKTIVVSLEDRVPFGRDVYGQSVGRKNVNPKLMLLIGRITMIVATAAAQASASTRSFSGWPECPRTHLHSTRCGAAASQRACHSSAFLTGFLSAVRQPLRRQLWTHLVMPSRTYMLSV